MRSSRFFRLMWAAPAALALTGAPALGGEPPKVTLVKAGEGEKRELRYAFKEGAKSGMSMKIDMTVTQKGPMGEQTQAVPAVTIQADTEVLGEADGGGHRIKMKVTGVEVADDGSMPPMIINQIRSQTGQIVGLTTTMVLDDRGFARDVKLEGAGVDATLAKQFTSSAEQMTSPLPAEPVGVGAQWTVVNSVDTGGFTMDQTSTMTLVEMSGSTIVLDMKLEQSAAPQPLTTPGVPPGAAKLESMDGTGTGRLKLELSDLTPIESTTKANNDATIAFQMPGMNQKMQQKTELKMTIKRTASSAGADAED